MKKLALSSLFVAGLLTWFVAPAHADTWLTGTLTSINGNNLVVTDAKGQAWPVDASKASVFSTFIDMNGQAFQLFTQTTPVAGGGTAQTSAPDLGVTAMTIGDKIGVVYSTNNGSTIIADKISDESLHRDVSMGGTVTAVNGNDIVFKVDNPGHKLMPYQVGLPLQTIRVDDDTPLCQSFDNFTQPAALFDFNPGAIIDVHSGWIGTWNQNTNSFNITQPKNDPTLQGKSAGFACLRVSSALEANTVPANSVLLYRNAKYRFVIYTSKACQRQISIVQSAKNKTQFNVMVPKATNWGKKTPWYSFMVLTPAAYEKAQSTDGITPVATLKKSFTIVQTSPTSDVEPNIGGDCTLNVRPF